MVLFGLAIGGFLTLIVGISLLPLIIGSGAFQYISILMWVLPIIVPLLIVGIVLFAIMSADSTATAPSTATGDPLEVLKNRYARGEITVEEYERSLEILLDVNSPKEASRRLMQFQPASSGQPNPATETATDTQTVEFTVSNTESTITLDSETLPSDEQIQSLLEQLDGNR